MVTDKLLDKCMLTQNLVYGNAPWWYTGQVWWSRSQVNITKPKKVIFVLEAELSGVQLCNHSKLKIFCYVLRILWSCDQLFLASMTKCLVIAVLWQAFIRHKSKPVLAMPCPRSIRRDICRFAAHSKHHYRVATKLSRQNSMTFPWPYHKILFFFFFRVYKRRTVINFRRNSMTFPEIPENFKIPEIPWLFHDRGNPALLKPTSNTVLHMFKYQLLLDKMSNNVWHITT